MVLFVLFWLIWIALFVASILLVVLSPGCTVRSKPNWWQTAIAYNVWVPSFQDSDGDGYGDMQGLLDRLENLRKSGVHTIWPSPFLISDNFSNAVRSYDQMDPALGTNQLADKAISEIHDKGMKLVISVPIATTSIEHDWFLKSATASIPANRNYSGFYRWSKDGKEANFFTERKGLYYMHEKGNSKAAVLNWQNTYLRTHMFDWSAISDVVSDIRNHIDWYANESTKASGKKIALFASREEAKEKDKKQLVQSGLDSVINYELSKIEKNSDICHKNEGTVATCVHEILSDILLFHTNNPSVWPQWEFGNQHISRIASRVESRAHAELLLMLQLILPGTNNFYYGDELGMKNLPNDSVRQYAQEQSSLKMFSKLSKLRTRDDALMSGQTIMGRLIDGAFTIVRFDQFENATVGNVYVGAFNFSPNKVNLPFTEAPSGAKLGKSQIVTATSNVERYYPRQTVDFSSKNVELYKDEGIVFRYSV
ncbi:alpha amylase, catalytic domain protein [Ancylostoma ceylanicum]|uniref:alpha-glucosidase n=1 Tax=Ancylostoma ceylanicum TaxID=53326 RepID=A0A0D6L916_9BILA|nr:alpha amylase, catalytic domain protein [Ancylostoma ceylanicum]